MKVNEMIHWHNRESRPFSRWPVREKTNWYRLFLMSNDQLSNALAHIAERGKWCVERARERLRGRQEAPKNRNRPRQLHLSPGDLWNRPVYVTRQITKHTFFGIYGSPYITPFAFYHNPDFTIAELHFCRGAPITQGRRSVQLRIHGTTSIPLIFIRDGERFLDKFKMSRETFVSRHSRFIAPESILGGNNVEYVGTFRTVSRLTRRRGLRGDVDDRVCTCEKWGRGGRRFLH